MAQTPERDAAAAHAAAVRLGRGAAGHAPRLPPGQVPGHHRPGPGRDARGGDHHRHHRRLPRRDRAGLRRHPRRGAPGPVRRRVHLPVLDPARHARGRDCPTRCRPRWSPTATSGWPRWSPRRPGRRTRSWPAPRSRCWWPTARAARTRPRTGCRAGPPTTGWSTSPRPGADPRPGDIVTTVVTRAAPHYLLADGAPVSVRRTRGGDAGRPASVRRQARLRGSRARRLLGMPPWARGRLPARPPRRRPARAVRAGSAVVAAASNSSPPRPAGRRTVMSSP